MKDYNNLMGYALNIISHTPTFREFAIAMMEYMDEPSVIVNKLYEDVARLPLPDTIMIDRSYTRVDDETLQEWFHSFKAEQEKREVTSWDKIKEDIDELTNRIREYRNSDTFKKMRDFIGMLHYLAPYNAMLVNLQKPGAELVFSISKWLQYGRRPKLNGQQLITLMPFGPVQVMFDYGDTEPIEGCPFGTRTREDLMKEYYEMYKAEGEVKIEEWETLKGNLPTYGIKLYADFNAAGTYAGYIRKYENDKVEVVCIDDRKNKRHHILKHSSRYALSLNSKHDTTIQFVTLCHELGHLFCRHMFYDFKKMRKLTHKEEEFEAETVAWLVCKRHGVYNPSEKYLANFVNNDEIPKCSMDCIMKAVFEIEKMMKGVIVAKESLWYKNDKEYKYAVDKELVSLKDSRLFQR